MPTHNGRFILDALRDMTGILTFARSRALARLSHQVQE